MNRNHVIIALVVIGLAVAALVVLHDDEPPVPSPAPLAGIASPFLSQVAGNGIIEANGGNIAVGTPVAGIVKAIPVKWGTQVNAGDPLARIDDGDLQARLPLARARVVEAEAKLAMSRNALALVEGISDRRAVSVEESDNRRLTVKMDEAAVATARAGIDEIQIEMQRRVVRSPASGEVLQIRVHPGEYIDGGTPLMIIGDGSQRQVRVDIDENDAWRIQPDAPAIAYLRGEPKHRVPLTFERIEPYLLPKASLNGASTEHVDTRVLQVIYSFDTRAMPTYVGQQVDVFIDASASRHPSAPASASAPFKSGSAP